MKRRFMVTVDNGPISGTLIDKIDIVGYNMSSRQAHRTKAAAEYLGKTNARIWVEVRPC